MGRLTFRDMLEGAMLLCVIALVTGSKADTLWRAVNVDRSKIGSQLSTVTSAAQSLHQCGTNCDQSPTCLSWNFENQVCQLTDLMVSPLHKAATEDTIKFYTSLEKDLVVGSTVTAYLMQTTTALASNLARGIYNKQFGNTCYGSGASSKSNRWMLIELQSSQKIRKIQITTASASPLENQPNGAEIRVGSQDPQTAGDFSSYKLFGKLPDELARGVTYTVENLDGMTGRFVSIQTTTTMEKLLRVCYIFIA